MTLRGLRNFYVRFINPHVEFIESCLDNDFTVTLILYLNLLTNFEAKYGVYLETQELLGTQFLVIMAYFAVILINIVSKFKKLIQNSYDFFNKLPDR